MYLYVLYCFQRQYLNFGLIQTFLKGYNNLTVESLFKDLSTYFLSIEKHP